MTLRLTLIAIALLWLATRRQRRLHLPQQSGPRAPNDWSQFARRRPLDWPPQPEDWNAFHRVLAHLQLAEQPGIVWLNAVSDPLGRVYVDGQGDAASRVWLASRALSVVLAGRSVQAQRARRRTAVGNRRLVWGAGS